MTEEIYSRRSIRKFTDRPIDKNDLESILDVARVAPSAKNMQPWKFIVLQGSSKDDFCNEIEKSLSSADEVNGVKNGLESARQTLKTMKNAPVLVVVLDVSAKGLNEFLDLFASLSIGAAVQNMLLKAQELGIGSLWIGNYAYTYEACVKALQTTDKIVSVVALGYAESNPPARPRKSLDEIVEFR